MVKVESITVNPTTQTIETGKTATVVATVNPNNATDKNVVWSSDDTSIAAVSNGKITAKKSGKTTITVTSSSDNSIVTKVAITVTDPKPVNVAVTKITLDPTTLNLDTGKTSVVKSVVTPDNATNKGVKWSSSDATVADVSNGTITAKKAGKATITATSVSTNTVTATVAVNVADPKPADDATKPDDSTTKGE